MFHFSFTVITCFSHIFFFFLFSLFPFFPFSFFFFSFPPFLPPLPECRPGRIAPSPPPLGTPLGLPPILYNKASPSLIFPLSILFRTFFELHDIPSEWKHAIITPIFKKGAPSNPSNYRPIALTCTCCKIFESLIAAELLDSLKEHNLISKHQHCFLKRHSTNTNLLECLNDWTLSISNHKLIHIGYIDFQRAFDSISHPKLILKLSNYGFLGNLLFWIKTFFY